MRTRSRTLAGLLVCACAVIALVLLSTQAAPSPAAAPAVYVFPIPGGKVASPQTQLTFRGIPIGSIGAITVTGSQSGVHQGAFQADSDRHGGSFVPSVPFTPGETVTVQTSIKVAGANNGTYQFTVANPAGPKTGFPFAPAPRTKNDVQVFHSRPDLQPVRVVITRHGKTANGDVFLAPQYGPLQDGPMVLDSNGALVWFKPLKPGVSAADVRVQSFHGQKVLTWWQGEEWAGVGLGVDVINNTAYQQIRTVSGGNGMSADLHEFLLTKPGTALIISEYPVMWDTSSIGGPKQQLTLDSVVQEIDIPTGLVLFQWDSLDHIPLKWSYQALPFRANSPYDPYHVNSVDVDLDGNLIISARNTNGIYKVNRHSSAMMWVLGGKRSTFKLAPGACWAQQHDATIQSYGDNWLTMFDDDYGTNGCHRWSKGLKLYLNLRTKTAQPALMLMHAPPLHSLFEGNYEQLPNHDSFLGWGQQPVFSEYNTRGSLVFDGHFVDATPSYRVYRFRWSGNPQTKPAVAASSRGKSTVVYASWNGATNVAFWRVLGGSSPNTNSMSTVSEAKKSGFETGISVPAQAFVAVQALNSAGAVLQTSDPVQPH